MSQVDIRGRACQQRNQEVQRSEGCSSLQGASVATEVGQASGEWWEVESGRCQGPWEDLSFYPEHFLLK